MGAAISTNTQQEMTEIISKVMVDQTSTCSAEAKAKSMIVNNVRGDMIDVNNMNDSTIKVNLKCIAEMTNTTDMESAMKKQLEVYAKAKLEGVNLFQVGMSMNSVESSDKIVNEIGIKNIQTQLASLVSTNKIENIVDGNMIRVNNVNKSAAEVVNDTVSKAISNSSTALDLDKAIKSTAESEVNGLTASAISGGLLFFCCGSCIIAGVAGSMEGGGGGGGEGGGEGGGGGVDVGSMVQLAKMAKFRADGRGRYMSSPRRLSWVSRIAVLLCILLIIWLLWAIFKE